MTPPRLLMITAHPDDETMFFLPTIVHFRNNGYEIHILCLSSGKIAQEWNVLSLLKHCGNGTQPCDVTFGAPGDSNGLGKWRKQELYFACSLLGIPRRFISVIEDPRLQDGLTTLWQEDIVAHYVQSEIARLSPTKVRKISGFYACARLRWKALEITTVALQVITFDHNGASGHANHKQTSKGSIAGVDVAKHKLQLLLLVRIKLFMNSAQCLLRSRL